MTYKGNDLFLATALLIFSMFVYLVVGPDAPQGGDTVPNRYLPLSVPCADLTLENFRALWQQDKANSRGRVPYYVTVAQNGALVSTFGPAVPILSSPFYVLFHAFSEIRDSADVLKVSRTIAGALSAISVMLVYLLCRAYASATASFLASIVFAFGSGILSVASRGLWQHTWTVPLASAGMLATAVAASDAYKGKKALLLGVAAGLCFALCFTCRPQTACFFVAGALVFVFKRSSGLYAYLFAAFPVIVAQFAYNTWFFDSPLAFAQAIRSKDVALYKTGCESLIGSNPLKAALGLLVSPSRGLLVFCPWLVFALTKRTLTTRTLLLFLASALCLFLTACFWFDWWGGYTVFPRQLLEALPVLTVACAIGIDRLKGLFFRATFVVFAVWSALLAFASATHPGVVLWNEEVDVDRHPERVWDVSKSLPLRILEFREEERQPLRDSAEVIVVHCGVQRNPAENANHGNIVSPRESHLWPQLKKGLKHAEAAHQAR